MGLSRQNSNKRLPGGIGLPGLMLGLALLYGCAGAGGSSHGGGPAATMKTETASGSGEGPPPKIYVADSGNNRIVRTDDMTGANWTTLGTRGKGIKQLSNPHGVFVDTAGTAAMGLPAFTAEVDEAGGCTSS